MQLTVEMETDEISTLAYLAKILDLAKKHDVKKMGGVYPLPVVMAMNHLIESFDALLEGMDSPFEIGNDVTEHATILAHRMQQISEELFEMKADFENRRAQNKEN